MSSGKGKNIVFGVYGSKNIDKKKIFFTPNEAAQRVLRSNYSDINELKSYLNPRGKIY